jgi:nucleoside-diphosphate-sugar epimerase
MPPVSPNNGICVLTGTSGYVGSRIAAHLADRGWKIRALSRGGSSSRADRFAEVEFDLGGPLPPSALEGADAFVHAAYDFSLTSWAEIERVNIIGSRRLFLGARAAGIERVVLISTLASFPNARSQYGRAKQAIEKAVMDVDGAVIRPGLVWGAQGAAMFGSLRRVVGRLPIVPLFGPRDLPIATVHEQDLAVLVERVLEHWPEASSKLFVAASEQTLTFAQLLRDLASSTGRQPRLIRMPWRGALLGLRALERLGVSPPFRSDSLLSLMTTDPHPHNHGTGDAEALGVAFRPFEPTCRR